MEVIAIAAGVVALVLVAVVVLRRNAADTPERDSAPKTRERETVKVGLKKEASEEEEPAAEEEEAEEAEEAEESEEAEEAEEAEEEEAEEEEAEGEAAEEEKPVAEEEEADEEAAEEEEPVAEKEEAEEEEPAAEEEETEEEEPAGEQEEAEEEEAEEEEPAAEEEEPAAEEEEEAEEEEPAGEQEEAEEEEPAKEEATDEEEAVEFAEALADGGQPIEPAVASITVPADATILGVARQLESQEEYVEAAEAYEAMLLDDPGDLRALRPLIELYEQLEAWAELQRTLYMLADAIDDEERRLDLILQAAAVAEHKLEDVATASAHYELVLKIDPDHATAREYLEALRSS